MINGIDVQHLQTVHHLPVDLELSLHQEGEQIDFTLSGEFLNTNWRERLGRAVLGPRYAYSMRYVDGCLGLLTMMKEVRWLSQLHMVYAYRPTASGETFIQPIYVTKKRPGILGWVITHLLLWLTRLSYYALRGEDGKIYDNIRFSTERLLPVDAPIAHYVSEHDPLTLEPHTPLLADELTVQNSPILFGCRTGICGTCLVTIIGDIAPHSTKWPTDATINGEQGIVDRGIPLSTSSKIRFGDLVRTLASTVHGHSAANDRRRSIHKFGKRAPLHKMADDPAPDIASPLTPTTWSTRHQSYHTPSSLQPTTVEAPTLGPTDIIMPVPEDNNDDDDDPRRPSLGATTRRSLTTLVAVAVICAVAWSSTLEFPPSRRRRLVLSSPVRIEDAPSLHPGGQLRKLGKGKGGGKSSGSSLSDCIPINGDTAAPTKGKGKGGGKMNGKDGKMSTLPPTSAMPSFFCSAPPSLSPSTSASPSCAHSGKMSKGSSSGGSSKGKGSRRHLGKMSSDVFADEDEDDECSGSGGKMGKGSAGKMGTAMPSSVAPSRSLGPSATPSISDAPSATPSRVPSVVPSVTPSVLPSVTPSTLPSVTPSTVPSTLPSVTPSTVPSTLPSLGPSTSPM